MKNTKLLILLIFAAVLSTTSCISNKKVAYLQYQDELANPNSIVVDSLVRMYEAGKWGYQLQPNDLLSIKVSSQTPNDYNPLMLADRHLVAGGTGGNQQGQGIGYRVDPEGNIKLPVIGTIKASDLTLIALEDSIDYRLQYELEGPITKVNLVNFKFTVIGDVGSQNTFVTDENSLSLMQAISMAGGHSEFGDISRVKVVRWVGDKHFVYYVNLLDETFLSSEFYFIQPNDVIVIPPLKSKDFLKYVSPSIGLITSSISLILSLVTIFVLFQ